MTITEAMLLANTTDPESDPLTVSDLLIDSGDGSLIDNGDRTWTFVPLQDDDTDVSFSYLVSDGKHTVPGTASLDILSVNDAPTTSPVTLEPMLEDSGTLLITQAMLLANADDVDGPPVTPAGFVGPRLSDVLPLNSAGLMALGLQASSGKLSPNSDGSWSFTPDLNDDTAVSFTYSVTDGEHTIPGSATLDILPVNDAPTTSPVTLEPILEDSGALLITQAMLLANADDVDGPPIRPDGLDRPQPNVLPPGSPPLLAQGLVHVGGGNLNDNGDGTWSYTPAPNDDSSVRFTYTVTDGEHTIPGSATLDILPVNDAPVAVADSAQSGVGSGVNIAVLANDTDIDGGPLRVDGITQGSHGSVVVRADGVSVRYTPNAGFSGFDTFTYTVGDGAGGTAVGNVRVLVPSYIGTPGNDVPLGTPQADFIVAGDGNDRVLSYGGQDHVDGGRGNDTISGGLGSDTLLGGDGADTFLTTAAELAGDSIDGGNQIDTLQITDSMASMPAIFTLSGVEQISFPGMLLVEHNAWLDLSALSLSGSGNQIMGGVANSRIIGTRSADRISESAGNDDLRGADGNDTIMAGVGSDTVHGGNGNDTLGGSSATFGDRMIDTFVFNTPLNALTNVDTILGFEANALDVIALHPVIFSAIGPTLDASEFRSSVGGNAADANDFILYDPATGALYYDSDGSGAAPRVQFATLGAGLTGTVDAADFVVLPAGPV